MKIEDKAISILNKKQMQLRPEIIKKDEQILGITGTYEGLDTSDGTLSDEDIVSGKIGYSNSDRIVGTMPKWNTQDLVANTVVNYPNSSRIGIRQDLNEFISQTKAYVQRTDQLNYYIDYSYIRDSINLLATSIKKDEQILGMVGTYISKITETPEYNTLLEKTDTILGANSLYTYLDYIQSDGNQYIDTEFTLSYNTKIEMQFEYVNRITPDDMEGNYDTVLGARTFSGVNNYLLSFYRGGFFINGNNADGIVIENLDTPNEVQTIKIIGNRFYKYNIETQDYELKGNVNIENVNIGLSPYLFAENQNGEAKWKSAIKLHYCKIYSKSGSSYILERYFIPVINKATNEVCLYDRVSKTFFLNQGSGAFIAGPEKSSEDIVVEYSESIQLSNDIIGGSE